MSKDYAAQSSGLKVQVKFSTFLETSVPVYKPTFRQNITGVCNVKVYKVCGDSQQHCITHEKNTKLRDRA